MYLVIFLILPFLLALATSSNPDCGCVRIIVARASEETPGTGMMGSVALEVQKRIPGSIIEALEYPAKFEPYLTSQTQGVAALSKLLHDRTQLCPDTKFVLMGYSQGAHVTADVVCGASAETFPPTKPVNPDIAKMVSAVILMGDPSNARRAPYNQGSSSRDGIFPRRNINGCSAVSDRMVAFCDANDMFCDSGNSLPVHMRYVQEYGAVAADFALGMVNAA